MTSSGHGVAGAVVTLAFQASGTVNPAAVKTGPSGTYEIDNVIPGTYPKIVVTKSGFRARQHSVVVPDGGATGVDFTLS